MTASLERDTIAETLANARRRLLDARTPAGHWEGRLSSSALSTATASFALRLFARHAPLDRGRYDSFGRAGVRWLVATQNADGGWGDTTDSPSNISTTTLCWAALGAADAEADVRTASQRAGAWLTRDAGSLEPARLADAIARRYGDDRTFSVPILTMCALAGRLGKGDSAWRLITALPFELAAFPQSWFRLLRLPVVSYALPALIAMGIVRHHHRPTRNPVARLMRGAARAKTLRVLEQVQPPGGGFLEATPLTSFVAMSLVAAGEHTSPVVARAIEFLCRSARDDGSWPIDTNLATWVTTLSVNALAAGGALADHLDASERSAIRNWLLAQQYKTRHPYTGAAPGGSAWTDLPGGVPDADDTAGALIALRHLGEPDDRTTAAACAGVRWLLDLQNSDGGIPTFCRGWGKLPFDRSAPELTAHALLAWGMWSDKIPPPLGRRVDRAARRAIRSLRDQQRPDGSWLPLWFGNQLAPDHQNPTHGTSRVISALCRYRGPDAALLQELAARGVRWLLAAQNADGGWGAAPGVPSSIEETGQAVQALAVASADNALQGAIQRGAEYLARATQAGTTFPAAPIGLYFARLWYSERLYPLIATVGALGAT
jgi:squalene-hopene/tetraprenyl-beta-curcumene cyclase